MTFRIVSTLAFALGLLAGCGLPPQQPSEAHLRAPSKPAEGAIPPPVQVAPLLPEPKPTTRAETYSVVVHNVPVQDLLFALARDARVQIDIHSDVTGNVTLNAIDQTLPQLLARIARQVDMRYEVKAGTLVVQRDTPFLRVYRIDYVNLSREGSVTGTLSSQVTGSVVAGASGGGADQSNSLATIKAESKNKFWDSLEQNVKEILRETDKIVPASASAASAASTTSAKPAAGAQATQVASTGPGVVYREAASVISNREAGVLTVRATSRQHEKIQEFLDRVMVSARRQVQIEATVVEVELSNNYQRGIDWSFMNGPWNIGQSQSTFPFNGLNVPGAAGGLAIGYSSASLLVNLRLLEQFGSVRVLSSPSISALNNQIATLKVVDNIVYFEVKAQQSQQANAGVLATYDTTPRTVPVGLTMSIVPQISEGGTIALLVRPSITRVVRFVPDPNPALTNVQNLIPEIRTREMESVMRLQEGEIGVLGGLMQDQRASSEGGIPGVRQIPGIGQILANQDESAKKSELVIFLRPTIIRDASIDGDYRGYRSYLPTDSFLNEPNPQQIAPPVPPRNLKEERAQ
jgi:MSHA type pilus biogenesis protein MshL